MVQGAFSNQTKALSAIKKRSCEILHSQLRDLPVYSVSTQWILYQLSDPVSAADTYVKKDLLPFRGLKINIYSAVVTILFNDLVILGI